MLSISHCLFLLMSKNRILGEERIAILVREGRMRLEQVIQLRKFDCVSDLGGGKGGEWSYIRDVVKELL